MQSSIFIGFGKAENTHNKFVKPCATAKRRQTLRQNIRKDVEYKVVTLTARRPSPRSWFIREVRLECSGDVRRASAMSILQSSTTRGAPHCNLPERGILDGVERAPSHVNDHVSPTRWPGVPQHGRHICPGLSAATYDVQGKAQISLYWSVPECRRVNQVCLQAASFV